MKRQHLIFMAASALTLSLPMQADTLGGELSVAVFSHSAQGHAAYGLSQLPTLASVDNTFGWESTQDVMFSAALEHPFPFLPNLQVDYTKLSHSGGSTVTGFTWGDIVDFSGNLGSSMHLEMTDFTLYYELLDNWVNLDAGITARYVEGDIAVSATTPFFAQSENVAYDTWIPMVYLKGRFDVPATGLSLQAKSNLIGFGDTLMYDMALSARYTVSLGLGIEGGYRTIHLDSDALAGGLTMDIDFSGPYAAVVWDF